jgi:pimeloyl-ACP methyl ester carboxylesterase
MLAAALGVPTPALVLVGPRFAGFEAEEFRTLLLHAAKRWPEWAGEERRTVVAAMAAGIVEFEIEAGPWAAEVAGLPVLAIRGGDARVSGAGELARFRTLPVDARVESVPGHAHRVQHTAPAVVAALINDFLSQIGVLA